MYLRCDAPKCSADYTAVIASGSLVYEAYNLTSLYRVAYDLWGEPHTEIAESMGGYLYVERWRQPGIVSRERLEKVLVLL